MDCLAYVILIVTAIALILGAVHMGQTALQEEARPREKREQEPPSRDNPNTPGF
jgi:hypothetical protein